MGDAGQETSRQRQSSETARLHVYISGVVQGVCFRMYTRDEAERLGLAGWVRNLPDGRVEWVAEGPASDLKELLRWSKRGPPAARVDRIEPHWEDSQGDDSGNFRIR